jgi:hypothetical protein
MKQLNKGSFDLDLLRRRVREQMALRGVSQEMLSIQTGIGASTLSMQLRSKPYPTCSLDIVVALMSWLGSTDIKDFLRDTKVRKSGNGWTVNWMLLRILLQDKQQKLGWHGGKVAQAAGINRGSYTAFMNGNIPTPTMDNAIKLLAWLEIYDWREVCDE